MGDIIKVLSKKMLAGESMYETYGRVENTPDGIHIHWRDLRILNNVVQYAETKSMFAEAPGIMVLADKDTPVSVINIPNEPIFKNVASVEEVACGIHFHYGDMRIEMQPERFLMLARVFEQAMRVYLNDKAVVIPMEKINPYDPGHFANKEEWLEYDRQHPERTDNWQQHEDGIEYVVKMILLGLEVRPIAVVETGRNDKPYQRIDGFKRYMAHKRLGMGTIKCYVCDPKEASPGVQDGQTTYMEVEDGH